MSTSEARINANRLNAARSTGPKTEEGKENSRRNALKHGMTGAGVVLPESDAAEVERRAIVFADELMAMGEVGQALARRAALNSVRMERGADQQTVALSERVRQVEADFVAPDGSDATEADRLRAEACRLAMFDPSKEATLARQYEAAAERGFFRAIRELRQMEKDARAEIQVSNRAAVDPRMGSFFADQEAVNEMDAEFDAIYAELNIPKLRPALKSSQVPQTSGGIDLPIAAGRSR